MGNDKSGKLLVFGGRNELSVLTNRLLKRELQEVKGTKIQGPDTRYKDAVLCIYCDEPDADIIWIHLQELGVSRRIWKYANETERDWEPTGRLKKLYEKNRARQVCLSCLSKMDELPSQFTIVDDSSLCDYCFPKEDNGG
ncbi:MAG: hypothetical protein V1767_03940 [Chloroflexota bacterium]